MPPVASKNYKSGFCTNGQHEGTKPRGNNGAPLKTCTLVGTCKCTCHVQLDKMYEMTGMERVVQENPEWRRPQNTFVMPPPVVRHFEEVEPDQEEEEVILVGNIQLPPMQKKTYVETSSGRTAKGQLEDWVKQACDVWLAEGYRWECTPSYLSRAIAEAERVPTPSTGAIGAVFTRWLELGFANIQRKPTRFTGYTEDGIKLGLAKIKDRARLNRRRVKTDLKRGIR
jgi:hypothetical protein